MQLIRTLTYFGASLIIAASCTSAANADSGPSVPSQVVRVADLNLNSQQDAAELLRRIDSAAHAVCPDPDRETGIRANQARFCLKQAVEAAVRNINSPVLTALVREHARTAPTRLARSTP